MLIFGSYLNGGKSLLGEAVSIAALDTFVAITAGSSFSRRASPTTYSRTAARS